MNDLVHLVNDPKNDPAAILLQSARGDQAPSGAKDRARALFGVCLPDPARKTPEPRATALPQHVRVKRTKRAAIAKLVPFQNLISPPKPSRQGKLGGAVIAMAQVAVILAALFAKPVPTSNVINATADRHNEPELTFVVAKPQQTKTSTANQASIANTKSQATPHKVGPNVTASSVLPNTPEARSATESVVGGEHAGALAENDEQPKTGVTPAPMPTPVAPESALEKPMAFQEGMTRPTRIAGREPSYPQVARMRGIEGLAIIRCTITEKGSAQNCTVVKSPAYLDEALLSAAHTWQFSPVMWQGRPVAVNYVFRYNFTLR